MRTIRQGRSSAPGFSRRTLGCLALALSSVSCLPAIEAPPAFAGIDILVADMNVGQALQGSPAVAANAALPFAPAAPGEASGFLLRAVSATDRSRALDCLAEAIYYEARSESKDGQRAVAQVVLNRVRHPAWPSTVCGVVYQGPLRPGGGCQFTFTCDGSMAVRPSGPGWAQARRIAAAFLAGETYAPVGLSTHYHTHAVFPAWAPRLMKTAMIGAHNFYRLPGNAGTAGAFTAAYAGGEPLGIPSAYMARRAAPTPRAADLARAGLTPPRDHLRAPSPAAEATPPLPPSTIREEYSQSGQWRTDAPAALTGR